MRTRTNIHRALARSTLQIHESIKARQENTEHDRLVEREQQFQHDFSGAIGSIVGGTEGSYKVLFDIFFVGDYGNARDSQLGFPVCRFGFHMDQAPAGLVPYAYVGRWVYDDDLNFIGAHVTFGVHSTTNNVGPFRGKIHATFQGYGAPIEQYDDGTATAVTLG